MRPKFATASVTHPPEKRLSPSSGWQQTWTFYSSTHFYLRFTAGAASIIRLWLHFFLTTLCRDWEPNSSQSHHLGILFRRLCRQKYFLLWSYLIEKPNPSKRVQKAETFWNEVLPSCNSSSYFVQLQIGDFLATSFLTLTIFGCSCLAPIPICPSWCSDF